ncbi:MAG: sigma-54 dependent transcriptional regulator [Candidatus Hinthialibacter antarcticus]|nr:sigma-54 dependent transcriptional regulator [Candidatus Hinthialibacter antarcticus]
MLSKILIIDDDETTRLLLESHLAGSGYEVRCEGSAEGLRTALTEDDFQAILLDVQLPDGDGIDLLDEVKQLSSTTPVIMITAHRSVEKAVEAIRKGAYNYCPKPIDLNRLTVSVKNALDRYDLLQKVTQFERAKRNHFYEMIGGSAAMQVIYHIIENVAPTKANVLITGESGTGKELVARAIHDLSDRKGKEIIDVNCAAIPKDLLESELFGHEKSAFTGAAKRNIGRCEQAHQSTLFLDEITDMNMNLQPKLLRFLQDYSFYRVGGKDKIQVDVRVVSASNRDPMEAIEQSRLREDLYYRLNVVNVPIPPLRDRKEDIPELAEIFLQRYSQENQKSFEELSSDTLEALCNYDWPGNVRQLQNCLQQCVVLGDNKILEADMLPDIVRNSAPTHFYSKSLVDDDYSDLDEASTGHLSTDAPRRGGKIRPLIDMEQEAIDGALQITHGNVALAASALQISTATLYRKVREYGFQIKKYKDVVLD